MLSKVPVECPAFLLTKAKQAPPMIVAVANAGSELALSSAKIAYEEEILVPILVGEVSVIRDVSHKIGWDISRFHIESAMTESQAAETAVGLAKTGQADAIMKGDVHTDVLMRAVLNRDSGLRTGNLLSHVFHMTLPGSDQSLCITDAVLNVLPTLEQKLDIAKNAIALLHALGNLNPRIALLSASETQSATMPSTLDAAEIMRQVAKGELADAIVDGPLAFDLAVSVGAARIKGVTSPVAGQADVLLVPNIETGNALFKMMAHFMSAAAAGIVLGAKVPIMLTSRADPVAARLASAALTAVFVKNNN